MQTYVCALSTDNYLDGVLVLNENLKFLGSKYPLLCLINENISRSTIETLDYFDIKYKIIKKINYINHNEANDYWIYTFDKLNVFSLTDYEKVVYLDSDLLILENLDHLFECPTPSMSLDLPWYNDRYNTGIMVITPNIYDYNRLKCDALKSDVLKRQISDQDIINEYFDNITPLSFGYNMVRRITEDEESCDFFDYIGSYSHKMPQCNLYLKESKYAKVIHYIGKRKPFMLYNDFGDKYSKLYFFYLENVRKKKFEFTLDKKLISVIIPIYNKEKYLRKCLDSVTKQTYKNLEIILINDASKDNSLKICKEYAMNDKRIKLLTNKRNKGVSYSRNKGLEIATGDYISFIDADDKIEKSMYELLISDIVRSDVDFVQCRMILNGQHEWRPEGVFYGNYSVIEQFLNDTISLSCCDKLFKFSCIKQKKFREDVYKNEDAMFIFDIVKDCNSIMFSDKYLYNYIYKKEDSLTGDYDFDKDRSIIEHTTMVYEYIKKYYRGMLDKIVYKWYKTYCYVYQNITKNIDNVRKTDIIELNNSILNFRNNNKKNLEESQVEYLDRILDFFKSYVNLSEGD